jgi:hypothetical protein
MRLCFWGRQRCRTLEDDAMSKQIVINLFGEPEDILIDSENHEYLIYKTKGLFIGLTNGNVDAYGKLRDLDPIKVHEAKTRREQAHHTEAKARQMRMAHSPTAALRKPPDSARCRTHYLRFCDLSECLMNPQPLCEHGLRLGYRIFCFHPQRREFEISRSRLRRPPV